MDYDFILIYDYLDNFDNKILKNLFENINSFLVFFYFYGGIDQSWIFWFGFSFGIFVLLLLCFNFLICCIIFRNKNLYIVINIFFVNMVMLDILLVLINVLLNIVCNVIYEWMLGIILCKVLMYFIMVFFYVFMFILIVIVFDRQ